MTPFSYTPARRSETTTLNDIPNGTVFEGTIYSSLAKRSISGVFIKVMPQPRPGAPGTMAICLTDAVNEHGDVRNWYRCSPVTNYRPLKNPRIVEEG